MKKRMLLIWMLLPGGLLAQQKDSLSVDAIMRDARWIGTSPSDVFWAPDSRKLYFNWNPDGAPSDSLYYVTLSDHHPRKATPAGRLLAEDERDGAWDATRTRVVFTHSGTLYLLDVRSGTPTPLLRTLDPVTAPRFGFGGSRVVYRQGLNLFSRDLKTGEISQLTDFRAGKAPQEEAGPDAQQRFLRGDALHNSSVLRERARNDSLKAAWIKAATPRGMPKTIYLGAAHLSGLSLSPDGRFAVYRLATEKVRATHTEVPEYVTLSGLPRHIPGRSTAGAPLPDFRSYVYDRQRDTVYPVRTDSLPGIRRVPGYLKDYPARDSAARAHPEAKAVCVRDPVWNEATSEGFVEIRALDHKDRWLMMLDNKTGKLRLLDHQHDSAWIGGPDIGWQFTDLSGVGLAYFYVPTQVNGDHGPGYVGWVDNHTVWFQSEVSGYSHLYLADTRTGEKRALTSGKYEVLQAELSRDGKSFDIITNRGDPGGRQFYHLDMATGAQTQITASGGGTEVSVSPDGNQLAVSRSTIIHPWELYLQPNRPGTTAQRVTFRSESAAYQAYRWRTPEIITFRNRSGLGVHAEIYRPSVPAPSHPGVIFVHGAGYLQDVHHWWSYYFREHMFMNLLADRGYTVMDIDYQGSAGYGRTWRTAIYRHMGGRDLDDEVDGARYLSDSLGVDSAKIGIWGGSYGGFMTLMAMCTTQRFACGAALRSVTDFAHYNSPYASAILNTPQEDSLAYVRSSPIYFASGLHGRLLMCHGMVDTNVHFQDIVRMTQKFIELGKTGWQLAVYPVESHDFVEPSSWTDEYRRILALFETSLK